MKKILLFLTFSIYLFGVKAQVCNGPFAKILGSKSLVEKGYSIAESPLDNSLFLGGVINDSVAIIKITDAGDIVWIRTFDIVPGSGDHVHRILLDSDGMIVIAGVAGTPEAGGTVFAFRYNPTTNAMLWCNRYISTGLNYSIGINEIIEGGDFLLTNNPHQPLNNAELFKLNRLTGDVDFNFSKHYHVGSSESLADFVYHDGFLYATGRFTDGPSVAEMRNTLIKLDPSNGLPVWTILGHIPIEESARLYGVDLVIDQNELFSLSLGDPGGTSIDFTQIFLQKTNLDGEVQWLKQYDLPGTNDWVDEIVSSDNGFVIMARNRTPPSDIILFKVDRDGNVLWANKFDFSNNDNSVFLGSVQSQLVESAGHLYFTASADFGSTSDIIFVKTDQQGSISDTCSAIEPVEIIVNVVEDPFFYSVNPVVNTFTPDVIFLSVEKGEVSTIETREVCSINNSIFTVLSAIICNGNSYDGYTQSGSYSDTFSLASGCDSVRLLHLDVVHCNPFIRYNLDDCTSFMSDGTNMDYSEFTPEYVSTISCAEITASTVYRESPQMNKHSCTPGLNASEAMCISALDACTFEPGDQASLVIEVTITPDQDSLFRLTGFSFYEKAPINYNWISGPSGLNNYPTLYGIRIIKNNVEIYKETDIPTSPNWTLQSFDFIDNDLFTVAEPSVFRIELLPYCLIGNGEPVAAWDLEDIVLIGGCLIPDEKRPVIIGYAEKRNGEPYAGSEMRLSPNVDFNPIQSTDIGTTGKFIFKDLVKGEPYFITGFNNQHPLNGVTTQDLIRIQKHLLGIEPFTHPTQYIAADVDNNQKINVLDILILQKLILGFYNEIPGNTSWRFWITEDKNDFADHTFFQDIMSLEELNADSTFINVLAIKTGDITGDARNRQAESQPSSPRSETFNILFENKWMTNGIPSSISIKAGNADIIEGLQMAIKSHEMTILSIEGKAISLTDDNYHLSADGSLRLSSNLDIPVSINKDEVLFTITLVPHFTGFLSGHLSLDNAAMEGEMYTFENSAPRHILLNKGEAEAELGKTERIDMTISPNPFKDKVNIHFTLDKSMQVNIAFYTSIGTLLFMSEKFYIEGSHTLEVSNSELGEHQGVLYAHMSMEGFSAYQKIVMLK